ncbi:MAG: hypothetical protein LBR70_03670 [Lactobacillaceae bacterium]|jgi:methyl-accepting chemotaxis protein|nr:hypothetical protein [Lactobacillaceae bacterium]
MSNEPSYVNEFEDEVVITPSTPKTLSNNVEIEKDSWLANNLNRLMISISVIWFAIVLVYITKFFGWSNLFLMMPNEFGGFLAGVTLPLAVIWIVVAYIDRGTGFKKEAKFLRAYMNQLVFPEEGSAQTAKAMADAIRSQIVELQQVTKVATKQTDIIKNELSARVDDFARLVSILDNYSGKSMTEVAETVDTLVKSFEYVTATATGTTDNFKDTIADFSVAANTIQKEMHSLLSSLLPKLQELDQGSLRLEKLVADNEARMVKANDVLLDFGAKSSTNMEYVTDLLNNQMSKINNASLSVVDEYNGMEKLLDNSLTKVDTVLKNQSKVVLEHVDLLNKKSDFFVKKISDHGDVINIEMEKILARTSGIEESIAIQIRDLDKVAKEVDGSMRYVEDSINEQIVNLDEKSKYAVSSLKTVVDKFENEISRISDITDTSIGQAEGLSSDIEAKNSKLQAVSETIVAELKALSQELEANASQIKLQSEESVARFSEVDVIMKKNAEALTEVTSVVVSQSKIGETSLAQQQRHIADSINKLEATKGELKRQIDELTRSATIVNQEAESSLVKLRQQLDEAITTSEEVNKKSKNIVEELQHQAGSFEDTTTKALAKATKVEEIIANQNRRLENISDILTTRTESVADALDKHSKLVEDATSASEKTHANILSSFESQSVLLNSVAENTVSYVSDVVQALDEKAETINLLFKHQENEFKDICERISENTGNIGASLKQNLNTIEQSSDRIFARMELLEEDINKRSDVLLQNTNHTIDKLSDVDKAIVERSKNISDFAKDSSHKLVEITDNFKSSMNTFGSIVKEVKEESNAVTTNLLGNFNRVKEVNNTLVQETQNISNIIDNTIKTVDTAIDRTKSKVDNITETFDNQKENLSDIMNVLATQTRLGEASLSQQYKILSDVSTDVAKKINDINNKFKDNTDKVFETSGKIAYEIDVLGNKLVKIGEDIAKSSKSTVKDVEQVNMSLNNCAENLAQAAKESTVKVGDAIKGYEDHIARFNTVTSEASSGVVEISGLITEQSDKMIKISEDTKELVECFNVVLNDTSLQLSNRANYAYDKVKGLGESFKTLSMQLEESAKTSSKHMENSGDKLRASIGEIASNAERIAEEIRSSSDVLEKQSQTLAAASEGTLKKVGEVMDFLKKSTTDFVKKTDEITTKSASLNDTFNKQLDVLSITSKKADTKIKELEKGLSSAELDSFFKSATKIVEQLEAMSVDINRLYSPDTEDELWKKYYNGDSSAFVRHLSKVMTKKQIASIRDLFEKNADFRTFVTRYISEFEYVLEKAKKNEKSSLLLSVLSGSDIGKIYYTLVKALDKLDA